MPYISKDDRIVFDADIEAITPHLSTIGELTYVVYRLCLLYIRKHGLNYANIALVAGALVCTSNELYRRVGGPYEEGKRKENGDIQWDVKN